DALALKARIELIDAPFGLGPIGFRVDLDFSDAVGQRLYLLLGVGKRGLACLQRLRQDVRPFRQRRPRLLELAGLGVERIAGAGEPLDDLIRGVASDVGFHRLALQAPLCPRCARPASDAPRRAISPRWLHANAAPRAADSSHRLRIDVARWPRRARWPA